MASASVQLRTSKISVSAGRVAAARTWRLNPLLNWLRRTASATARCDAETQRPRPGSLRFKSGTTSPWGETTNRISSSIGRTSRLTAHIRMVADLSVRGPLSRSGSAKASMPVRSLQSSAHGLCAETVSDVAEHSHYAVSSSAASAGSACLARSASVIQPAMTRACMIMRSASSREVSLASRMPGCLVGSPPSLRSVQPTRSSVAQPARSSTDLMSFSPNFTSIFEVTPGTVVKTLDAGQFLGVDQREFLDRGEAFRGQQLTDHFVDVQRFHEHPRRVLEICLAALGFFLLGEDVDVPAGQLRSEPHILAATADRQRELVVGVGHHDLDPLALFVDHDLGDFGRRQRVDDKGRDIGRPRNDVDLLALQLVDHRLHARTAHTDAGADRIDRGIP